MRNILNTIAVCAAALIAAVSAGCNTQGCTDNRSALPLAGFYDAAEGRSLTLDSLLIHGIGAPGDSAVATPGQKISEVYLPMCSTAESTSRCIAYKWADTDTTLLNDTITFAYTAQPFLAGDECGAMYNYRIRRVDYTRHIVDSVAVVDSLITNNNLQQIRIYFRTEQSENPQP